MREIIGSSTLERETQLAEALVLPITRVAAETGFYDQAHLTRRFKGIVGVAATPASGPSYLAGEP